MLKSLVAAAFGLAACATAAPLQQSEDEAVFSSSKRSLSCEVNDDGCDLKSKISIGMHYGRFWLQDCYEEDADCVYERLHLKPTDSYDDANEKYEQYKAEHFDKRDQRHCHDGDAMCVVIPQRPRVANMGLVNRILQQLIASYYGQLDAKYGDEQTAA